MVPKSLSGTHKNIHNSFFFYLQCIISLSKAKLPVYWHNTTNLNPQY